MRVPKGFMFKVLSNNITILIREDDDTNADPIVYGAGRDVNPTMAQRKAIDRFYTNWTLVEGEWQLKRSCRG